MKRFVQWLLSPAVLGTLALLALSAIIWWVGPLVAIGSVRPLDPLWVRITLLLVIWLLWIARLSWKAWKRRKTNAALLAGLAAGPSASDKEAQVLAQRFNDAVTRLKASGGKSWFGGGGQFVYELPWYIFIGAPGSGKTTALMNAGLQFLLGDGGKGGKSGAVQGVGGTRNCEWWFTQDAVLIDTAGRYATQESDRDVDASAWDNFLALLKKTRPRQPINGVLLTVNIQDLLQQGTTERQEHAAKLRARLQELQTKLGVKAPVYVLVTKADLIGGFNESFEALAKEERDQVWGFTFAPETPADDPLRDFAGLYQQLQKRLVEQLVPRMEGERDVLKRSAMFAFPQEFAALQAVLGDFLRQVFSGGGTLETTPRVRGVYFTSGTQEGSPIDRVMGALGRSFGIDSRSAAVAGKGKSFFLHRLLKDVVFAERGLGIINPAAERRRRIVRAAVAAVIALFSTAVLVGWAVSRARNLDHAAMVAERVPPLKAAVDALPPAATADVTPLPTVLAQVRDAAKSEFFDIAEPPLLNGLGLYQGEKLDAAAQMAYTRLLEKTLMPRVSRRLEERLRTANKDNLENAYEALKTYLMLHLPEQFDAPTLRAWVAQDWDENYARMAPDSRAQLDSHLDAMLALGPPRAALPRDDNLVAGVREMLAAYPLEYRVYSRIRRQYRPGEIPEFTAAGAAGPNAAQVFQRASGEPLTKGISGLYTKTGYEKFVKPLVGKATSQLAKEESWVLGFKSDPARLKDILGSSAITDKVKRRYFEDYIKTWDKYIADVKLVKLTGLDRSMEVARTLGAVDSPLAAWLRGITEQTRLVPPPQAPGAIGKLVDKAEAKVAKAVGGSADSGELMERLVDDHFAAIHRQVTGTPPPIEATLKMFNEIYTQLAAVDAAQKSKTPPPPGGGGAAIKAAAAQLPESVRAVVEQLADAGASQSRGAEIQGLSTEMKPITEFCERVVNNRYPFASGARADTPLEDFGQLFGGGGLLDDFFVKRLMTLVDTTTPVWSYKPLGDGSKPVAAAALAEFQRGARIRDVFFRSGGKVPAMKVEMRIADMDPALKELSLDIDGVVQKLTSGGPPISIAWPSQRLASQIKLSTGLGNAGALVMFDGPWALFRLIDRFEVQPSSVPERFTLVMNLDGKRARVDVITSSVFNPFQMREVKQFRCPAAL